MNSNIKKFKALLIGLAILIITSGIFIQSRTIDRYKEPAEGKFIISIFLNNKPFSTMPQRNLYIYENYCFEESKLVLEHQNKTINKNDGKIITNNVNVRDSLIEYILTDLKNKMVYNFNASQDNPKLNSSYKLINKKVGFNFKDENIDIQELPNFTFIKDTVINKRKFSQLKSITDVGGQRKITSVYVDKEINNLMFHPLSKYLDDKFKGRATILETISDNVSFKIQYEYFPNLVEQERNQIEKYITLIKK